MNQFQLVKEEQGEQVKISIVIPALNEESRIGRLVEELRRLESPRCYFHEIIVADGGSTDATRREAELAGAVVIKCKRKGRAVQMNEGAAKATGDILYFLHADTVPPEKFDTLIAEAIENGAGAGCFQLRFSNNHPVLRFYGWCTRFKTTVVRFGDQSLFVTSENFRKVGGYDSRLIVMEDQKIVSDLKKQASFVVLDEAVNTSARTYEKNGVIRLQFIFGMIVILYYFGAKQDTLVHLYNSLIEL
ncbi:TIGR04283 family arsenosugar biosynthesis glycosyltransferase [Rhodohalobacter sp. 8-1]|uniref:TIGR04283 family arsenosugar biosynthesis glycosyltransferase n=1 Tax=Rhodohalobacter sp. 8-1 TaxID=3131972 RepID=UPI0030EE528F